MSVCVLLSPLNLYHVGLGPGMFEPVKIISDPNLAFSSGRDPQQQFLLKESENWQLILNQVMSERSITWHQPYIQSETSWERIDVIHQLFICTREENQKAANDPHTLHKLAISCTVFLFFWNENVCFYASSFTSEDIAVFLSFTTDQWQWWKRCQVMTSQIWNVVTWKWRRKPKEVIL